MNGRCSCLDLCLSPITSTRQSCLPDSTVSDQSKSIRSKEISAFHNGRLEEYDLEEIQIRAIIEKARKQGDVTALELAPVRLSSPLEFSVKRSVKRFLEKRKKKKKKRSISLLAPHIYTYTCSSSSSSHHF